MDPLTFSLKPVASASPDGSHYHLDPAFVEIAESRELEREEGEYRRRIIDKVTSAAIRRNVQASAGGGVVSGVSRKRRGSRRRAS